MGLGEMQREKSVIASVGSEVKASVSKSRFMKVQ